MIKPSFVATSTVTIKAPATQVWHALLDPAAAKKYMFGTTVTSDWQVGSPITWSGDYQGKPYNDHGVILKLEKGKRLQYSHFSPGPGREDIPENYHTVTIDLATEGAGTVLSLSQDKNSSVEARQAAEKNWKGMLESLKKMLEP